MTDLVHLYVGPSGKHCKEILSHTMSSKFYSVKLFPSLKKPSTCTLTYLHSHTPPHTTPTTPHTHTHTHTHTIIIHISSQVRCKLPNNIHSPWAHFGVAAHDGDAGSKGAINAEHHTLHPPRQHSEQGLCTC